MLVVDIVRFEEREKGEGGKGGRFWRDSYTAVDALEDWWGTKSLEALRRTSNRGDGGVVSAAGGLKERMGVVLRIGSLAVRGIEFWKKRYNI